MNDTSRLVLWTLLIVAVVILLELLEMLTV